MGMRGEWPEGWEGYHQLLVQDMAWYPLLLTFYIQEDFQAF
jgi:hypothetical protein